MLSRQHSVFLFFLCSGLTWNSMLGLNMEFHVEACSILELHAVGIWFIINTEPRWHRTIWTPSFCVMSVGLCSGTHCILRLSVACQNIWESYQPATTTIWAGKNCEICFYNAPALNALPVPLLRQVSMLRSDSHLASTWKFHVKVSLFFCMA